jgi:hypothetical protein
MECANAVTDGEIEAFNECCLNNAGETVFPKLLPNVTEGTTKSAREGDNETTGAEDLDDLGQMQLGTDDPSTVNPSAKVSGELCLILAQPVREKHREASKCESVAEPEDEGHGIGDFA